MESSCPEISTLDLRVVLGPLVRRGFGLDIAHNQAGFPAALEILSQILVLPLIDDDYLDTSHAGMDVIMPSPVDLEVHGHCAVISKDNVRIAELELQGLAASGFYLRTDDIGRQVLVVKGQPNVTRLLVRLAEFRVIDRGVGDAAGGWKTAPGPRDLHYLLDSAKTPNGRKHLLVIFSAIGAPYDFSYNYRSSLSEVDSNRLYIIDDFGARGSYYWVDHRERTIFDSVQELILSFLQRFNISLEDVIFGGSSKGGTAALLHGVALGVKEVWAGAPQYRVGDYLLGADESILRFMSGGSTGIDRDWLNEEVRLALRDGRSSTNIRLIIGSKDHHLEKHAKPLIRDAKRFGYACDLIVVEGFPHSEIGGLFAHYLTSRAHHFLTKSPEGVLPHACRWLPEGIEFRCWGTLDTDLCVDMHGEDGSVSRLPYSKNSKSIFPIPKKIQPVRFRVYQRSADTPDVKAFTTRWFFPTYPKASHETILD